MSAASAKQPGLLTAAALLEIPGVSRETIARLEIYADLLQRWQQRINLVGPDTLRDPWRRHFLDSAQLTQYVEPNDRTLTDLGSGAGFPGLVLAIVTGCNTHLIEANARKAAFLREAARETGATASVHSVRIEAIDPWPTDIITARALAPVEALLSHAALFPLRGDGETPLCLFLKGEKLASELTEAEKLWNMRAQIDDSLSDPSGRVLRISSFSRKSA